MALATGVVAVIAFPATALGAGGGVTPTGVSTDSGEPATESTPTPGSTECTTTLEGTRSCLPVTPAALVLGVAAPPETAPPAVKAAIAAANQIHTRPHNRATPAGGAPGTTARARSASPSTALG
jgi:hypothetical protein